MWQFAGKMRPPPADGGGGRPECHCPATSEGAKTCRGTPFVATVCVCGALLSAACLRTRRPTMPITHSGKSL